MLDLDATSNLISNDPEAFEATLRKIVDKASRDGPLNSIEIRHRDAILAAGLDPADFLFDAQLSTLTRDGGLTKGDAKAIHDLRGWASSRYEPVELLPLYYAASENIRTMQQVSDNRVPFEDVNFVVTTDPGQLVPATVDSTRFATDAVDHPQVTRRTDEPESIVWINTGSVNVLKNLATHFGHTLIAPYGNLAEFLSVMAEGVDPLDLVARLGNVDCLPQDPINTVRIDWPLAEARTILIYGFVTFLAGHEAGHIYLGHTGISPRATFLRDVPSWISPRRADEIDADIVGLISVWDGMKKNYGPSIDSTWLAPVLFLAARAGLAGADAGAAVDPSSAQAVDDFAAWIDRLRYLVSSIAVNLRGNGFEARQIRSILRSVPPLAGAVYAWLQADGMRTRSVLDRDQFDWFVYDLLKEDCSKMQSELGL
jgi:hypothetical protein